MPTSKYAVSHRVAIPDAGSLSIVVKLEDKFSFRRGHRGLGLFRCRKSGSMQAPHQPSNRSTVVTSAQFPHTLQCSCSLEARLVSCGERAPHSGARSRRRPSLRAGVGPRAQLTHAGRDRTPVPLRTYLPALQAPPSAAADRFVHPMLASRERTSSGAADADSPMMSRPTRIRP